MIPFCICGVFKDETQKSFSTPNHLEQATGLEIIGIAKLNDNIPEPANGNNER